VLHSNLGVALKASGKFAAAVRAYSDAIQIAPEGTAQFNASLAYLGRGVSERELHDFPSAIKDFSKAIQLNAKVAEFWFERGLAYKSNGAATAADDDFREAVKLDAKAFGPKVAALTTKTESNQPKVADNAPKAKDQEPKITEPAPKKEVAEPKVAETAPKSEGVEPKVAEDSPKSGEPTPKVAAKNPLVGKWVFRGAIGRTQVEMVTRFNADGTYQRVIRVTDCEGTQRSTDSGTFNLTGETLTLIRTNNSRSEHKVKMDDQSLAMNFPELGKTLVLDRAD
jgi:tetratricopeptide (TPR) repeat protein